MTSPVPIHHLDKMTYDRLIRMAKRRGVTPETVAIELIRTALSAEKEELPVKLKTQLDSLAGTWSEGEANAFLQAIADFSQIDESLWQ